MTNGKVSTPRFTKKSGGLEVTDEDGRVIGFWPIEIVIDFLAKADPATLQSALERAGWSHK